MDINTVRKAISAGIAQMDATALRGIVIEAQARINDLEAHTRPTFGSAVAKPHDAFRIGDLVEFRDRLGRRVRGNVTKFNPKTVAVAELEPTPGRKWRVSPTFLHLVGSDKVKVPEIKPVTPAAVASPSEPLVSGALPTVAGAGAW